MAKKKNENRKVSSAKIIGFDVGVSLQPNNFDIISNIPFNTRVDLLGYKNGFAHIKWDNLTGYVPAYYIGY